MDQQLEQQLVKKYPILFGDIGKSPQESCMAFGCEHGDGWYKLLDELCEYLTKLSKQQDFLKLKKQFQTEENQFLYIQRPTITFSQVKEKFGMLRIYWHSNGVENWEEVCAKVQQDEREKVVNKYYDEIQSAIDYVEFLSSKVCEECGESGTMTNKGWMKVRCEQHS